MHEKQKCKGKGRRFLRRMDHVYDKHVPFLEQREIFPESMEEELKKEDEVIKENRRRFQAVNNVTSCKSWKTVHGCSDT